MFLKIFCSSLQFIPASCSSILFQLSLISTYFLLFASITPAVSRFFYICCSSSSSFPHLHIFLSSSTTTSPRLRLHPHLPVFLVLYFSHFLPFSLCTLFVPSFLRFFSISLSFSTPSFSHSFFSHSPLLHFSLSLSFSFFPSLTLLLFLPHPPSFPPSLHPSLSTSCSPYIPSPLLLILPLFFFLFLSVSFTYSFFLCLSHSFSPPNTFHYLCPLVPSQLWTNRWIAKGDPAMAYITYIILVRSILTWQNQEKDILRLILLGRATHISPVMWQFLLHLAIVNYEWDDKVYYSVL